MGIRLFLVISGYMAQYIIVFVFTLKNTACFWLEKMRNKKEVRRKQKEDEKRRSYFIFIKNVSSSPSSRMVFHWPIDQILLSKKIGQVRSKSAATLVVEGGELLWCKRRFTSPFFLGGGCLLLLLLLLVGRLYERIARRNNKKENEHEEFSREKGLKKNGSRNQTERDLS